MSNNGNNGNNGNNNNSNRTVFEFDAEFISMDGYFYYAPGENQSIQFEFPDGKLGPHVYLMPRGGEGDYPYELTLPLEQVKEMYRMLRDGMYENRFVYTIDTSQPYTGPNAPTPNINRPLNRLNMANRLGVHPLAVGRPSANVPAEIYFNTTLDGGITAEGETYFGENGERITFYPNGSGGYEPRITVIGSSILTHEDMNNNNNNNLDKYLVGPFDLELPQETVDKMYEEVITAVDDEDEFFYILKTGQNGGKRKVRKSRKTRKARKPTRKARGGKKQSRKQMRKSRKNRK